MNCSQVSFMMFVIPYFKWLHLHWKKSQSLECHARCYLPACFAVLGIKSKALCMLTGLYYSFQPLIFILVFKKKNCKVRMIIFLYFVECFLALCSFIAVLILKVDDCISVVTWKPDICACVLVTMVLNPCQLYDLPWSYTLSSWHWLLQAETVA